jgi:hypothetical protein
VDITGWSFVLTVNTVDNPVNTDHQVAQIVGVIADAAAGVVEFTPTLTDVATAGSYYYDIEAVDAGGSVSTLDKGAFTLLQDITKNVFLPLVWNVEDQPVGSGGPANVFDTYAENLAVRAIPSDGYEPITAFTKELYCTTGNPVYFKGIYVVLLLDALNIDLHNGAFRVEIVSRISTNADFQTSTSLFVGEDNYYPEWDEFRMFKSDFYTDETIGVNSGHFWAWEESGLTQSETLLFETQWNYGNPKGPMAGYCLHQIEVDFKNGIFRRRVVGHWAGDQGQQSSWWIEGPASGTFLSWQQVAQSLQLWLSTHDPGEAMITQIWVGSIISPFPGGAVLEANYE